MIAEVVTITKRGELDVIEIGGNLPDGYRWVFGGGGYHVVGGYHEYGKAIGIIRPGEHFCETGFSFRQSFWGEVDNWSMAHSHIHITPSLCKELPRNVFDYLIDALDNVSNDAPVFHSPIEKFFWHAWQSDHGFLIPIEYQYEVEGGKYRFDFAIPDRKVAIELDGYEWHSSREQFTKDRQRQREIEMLGWRVVRFSGREVVKNPSACYDQAITYAYSVGEQK